MLTEQKFRISRVSVLFRVRLIQVSLYICTFFSRNFNSYSPKKGWNITTTWTLLQSPVGSKQVPARRWRWRARRRSPSQQRRTAPPPARANVPAAASASPSDSCSKRWTSFGTKTASSAAAATAAWARSVPHCTQKPTSYYARETTLGENRALPVHRDD